jgi:hypothetical protein
MILTCKKCKNVWDYKGANSYCACCSRCKSTVFIKKSPHIADIWLQREEKEENGQEIIESNDRVLGE